MSLLAQQDFVQFLSHDLASLLQQLFLEQEPPKQLDVEQELKNKLTLKINTNGNIYFFIISPYFLQHGLVQLGPHCFTESTALDLEQVICVLHELLQLFIQQTALITPHVKTPTKITFKANSKQSLQELNFSQFIQYPLIFY